MIAALISLASTAPALAMESSALNLQESFTQLEKAIQSSKDSIVKNETAHVSNWPELEKFQTSLWRAMALDPLALANVPVNEVPKELFAAELNQDLHDQLENLKKSTLPKTTGAETEFNQYLSTATQILKFRDARQFPQARAIAKRGILDGDFLPLLQKAGHSKSSSTPNFSQIEDSIRSLKEQVFPKDSLKRELLTNGNSFVWYAVAVLFGFLAGVLGLRQKPDFFQRFAETIDSSVPAATTHSGGTNQLDYARWLKELEEILSRFKTSQLSHERRIEDLVKGNEKLTQQAISLASDARIKNETNLEFRVSNLMKGLQAQAEQGHRLQAGDRAQINIMLEHCFKLCDAIEAGAIHYDRDRPEDPPVIKSA